MFRNSGGNALNRLSLVSFFIGADLVQNVILYILFQLTFSINQLLRGCGLLGLYVLLAQFLTLPLTKVYVGDGGFLGK